METEVRDYKNQSKEELAKLHAFAALAKAGVTVYWKNKGYKLKAWENGVHIVCTQNSHAIGLFHRNDTGANAFANELFVEMTEA